jgi:hypothetical protein
MARYGRWIILMVTVFVLLDLETSATTQVVVRIGPTHHHHYHHAYYRHGHRYYRQSK